MCRYAVFKVRPARIPSATGVAKGPARSGPHFLRAPCRRGPSVGLGALKKVVVYDRCGPSGRPPRLCVRLRPGVSFFLPVLFQADGPQRKTHGPLAGPTLGPNQRRRLPFFADPGARRRGPSKLNSMPTAPEAGAVTNPRALIFDVFWKDTAPGASVGPGRRR